MMFRCYLNLRFKLFVRLWKELGLFRSLFLTVLLVLAAVVLCRVENEFVLPVASLLMLVGYHHARKDRAFLQQQVPNLQRFLQKEYLLLGLFPIVVELFKGQLPVAIGLLAVALLLPYQKQIHFHFTPIRQLLLSCGNLAYIRMFRRYWWVYLLLLLFSLMGYLHGNVRIAKVSLVVWGFIQSDAYCFIPDVNITVKHKSYGVLQRLLWMSNGWNVFVLFVPFLLMTLCFDCSWSSVIFMLGCVVSNILYLQNCALFHLMSGTKFEIILFQLCIFLPLYLFSCLLPLLNLFALALVGVLSYVAFYKLKSIWN